MSAKTTSAFRAGHASHSDWKIATEQALKSLGPGGGSLGFMYFTENFAPYAAEMLTLIKTHTGIADWTGSVGIGVLANGTEYLDEPAVALLTCGLPPGGAQVFSGHAPLPRPGTRTASGALAANFAIVHADPNTPDIDELIADMAGKVESGYLAGGLSSARGNTVQIANQVVSGGVSGVVFASDVAVATRLTQGCVPVGARHIVTSCENNIIISLDNRPALEVMLASIGLDMKGLRTAARDTFVGLVIPGAETAAGGEDYMVRNLVGIDPQNKLIAIGDTPTVNQPLFFCKRDAQSARDDLVRMIYDLKDDLTEPPKAALYHACVGRGQHMFGEIHAEMRLIREHLGDIPLAGFLAAGEIARDRLYGFTGVLTIFK